MPKDFIKSKHSHDDLLIAAKQQKQLSYFTESKVQSDITIDYITNWAERNYRGSDYFLNFLKSVFKTENFLLIFKHLRHPLPSARLIQDKIKAPLKRVFYSEDPFFKYNIKGESVKEPQELNISDFNEWMFNSILFRHNDILVTDLDNINSPYRSLIEIDNVVSIESNNGIISKIAYTAEINDDEKNEIKGILYIDAERYVFYSQNLETEILNIPHDLGRCPADYISSESFANEDVVRKSIFSYVREELEEYSFLKALQRMVEVKSAIPTVAMLDIPKDNPNEVGEGLEGEPMSASTIGGQRSDIRNTVDASDDVMGVGNVAKLPLVRNDAGEVEIEILNNYIKFFYIPIESLNYLNDRIKEVKNSIISNIIGDYSEGSTPEGSKSDSEINKVTIVSKQDKLRELSAQLSRIRTRSDYNFLALKYGRDNVKNEAFYGSDFFLDTQETIYNLLAKSPNPIESKSLLIKSARNRHRFNKDSFTREYILYHLIPYGQKEDFNLAIAQKQVGDITFQLQTRFNYWIGLFESQYGDILSFWNENGGTDNEKIVLINNLITIIIKDNYEKSSVVTDLQGVEGTV